jgi:opacity protein-like surface antigen
MTHLRPAQRALVMVAAVLACAPAVAADPFGFYLGAGVGHSQVRSDLDFGVFGAPGFSGPFDVAPGATGWKVIAGVRPLSIIGAEAEYIDFGSGSGTTGIEPTATRAGITATATSHPKAPALFAVGYLPIPLPRLDVFAKAGVADLKTGVHASGQALCPTSIPCLPVFIPPYSASHTSTRFAYGAGVQLRLATLAVRAEYERIHSSAGDPDLLSLALTWSLL